MKKILFVSPTSTFDNGAEKSIFYLMELMVARGYKVFNVCQKLPDTMLEKHIDVYKEAGITNIYLPAVKWWWEDAPGEIHATKEQLATSYRQNIEDISEILTKYDIDLVISNTVNVFQGAVAAALNQIPHYWLIHEFPEKEFAYYLDKCDFISDYSTEIFSVAGNLNQSIQHLFPNRQVRNFIPYTKILDFQIPKGEKKRIVCVGRLTERKNQLELIKAFELLKKQGYSDFELVFIGSWDGDYKDKCDAYIKKQGLESVSFLGQKDNPWEELTDKDICVFTSSQETFGMVYVEAVLKGLPVIISDNLGHKTAFDLIQVGKMYELGNMEQLVSFIKESLEDFDNEFIQAQEDKKKVATAYTIEQVYKEIIDQIEQMTDVVQPNSIRHLESIVSTNPKTTKLERAALKLSNALYRFRRKIEG